MELRALLLLPLCFPALQAQRPDAEERQAEGSTLSIRCPYTARTDYQQQKAWCRARDGECEPLVETTQYRNEVTKGKVTILDDGRYKTVSITMTNLQAEDSGTYSCAYRSDSSRYIPLRTISLIVFKELHTGERDSLSVQCPYSGLEYGMGTKVWCRREGQTKCQTVARSDHPSTQQNSQALEDRTLIHDDTQKRTVSITMQKLQAQDSGVYWCAFYRGPKLIRIMEFQLSMSKSEAPNSLSSISPVIPSNSTESTIGIEEEMKQHRLQTILWLVFGIVSSKILAIVILVLLTRRVKRTSSVKASR